MKKLVSIDRPCAIMTGFTSYQLCFLGPLFCLPTQDRIINMLELMSLVIACLYNTQNDVGSSRFEAIMSNYDLTFVYQSGYLQQMVQNKSQPTKEDEKEEEANWLSILEDFNTQKDLHIYSPERNGVIRKAPTLNPLDADVPNDLAEKMNDILNVVQKKKPSITYSEAVYNNRVIFRLMYSLLDEFDEHETRPFFIPGEEELISMTKQIQTLKVKVDHRKVYKADGIVRCNDDLELMIVETAGAFKKDDACKITFDNSKGMFALLAMLKTIADKYSSASSESFKKLKLLYLQPSDCHLRLWQMKYEKNGLYEYARIAKVTLSEEKEDGETCLNSLNQFMLKMKECLNETLDTLRVLEEEHEDKKREANSEDCSQEISLSDVICPRIFRISFGKHSKGFAQETTLSPYNQ